MASQRSKQRSRKRRNPGSAPRAAVSHRRDQRAQRIARVEQERRRGRRPPGRRGERPESPFGGLPISELAILVGFITFAIGYIQGGGAALIAGIVVCALGVVEVTAREHFSGYRSHTALLAAIPAVAAEVGVVAVFGQPRPRLLLLVVVVPVFVILFWLLRRKFLTARQARLARLARPPAPPLL